MKWILTAGFVAALGCGSASADLILTMQSKDLTVDPPRVEVEKIYLTADKLKLEPARAAAEEAGKKEAEGGKGEAAEAEHGENREETVIFRADRNLIWTIDPHSKSYLVFDRAYVQQLSGQMSEAMKEIQEQLAKLPEEQRKMVEQHMKEGMAPGAGPAKQPLFEMKNSGVKQTIGGQPCVRYDSYFEGEKSSEIWVAKSWDKATPEALQVFKKMAVFYRDLLAGSPMMQNVAGKAWGGLDQIDGVPVLIREYSGDTVTSEKKLETVEDRKLDPSTFEVPGGFTEKKLPGTEQMRGER